MSPQMVFVSYSLLGAGKQRASRTQTDLPLGSEHVSVCVCRVCVDISSFHQDIKKRGQQRKGKEGWRNVDKNNTGETK